MLPLRFAFHTLRFTILALLDQDEVKDDSCNSVEVISEVVKAGGSDLVGLLLLRLLLMMSATLPLLRLL